MLSRLTQLLADSLAGNCRTTMIACVSPAADLFPMTSSTLRFAKTVSKVFTAPVRNEEKEGVTELRMETDQLRRELRSARGDC